MNETKNMEERIYRILLTDNEVEEIRRLIQHVTSLYNSVEQSEFLRDIPLYAQELPRSLRAKLNHFRLLEPAGVCLLTGYPVDDKLIGPTPSHWKVKKKPAPTLEWDVFFFLCTSLLGDPIGWATQQDGYILHDVLPIKGHEHEQLGTGSEELLTWHTEDAFHPYRADYISLMCLRNHDGVETTFASIENLQLEDELVRILSERRFIIRPDNSHLEKNRSDSQRDHNSSEALLRRSYDRVNQMINSPDKIAVLFGDPKLPYMRLDPYFMAQLNDDPEAMATLNKLIAVIDEHISGISLQPGEILLIDNYKVVHGRVPFKARYDGTDRWLRRLNIARDLRKSREARIDPESRIIF